MYTVFYILIGAVRELEFYCGNKLCDLEIKFSSKQDSDVEVYQEWKY